jgi:lipopolysaccharide export system permease protein
MSSSSSEAGFAPRWPWWRQIYSMIFSQYTRYMVANYCRNTFLTGCVILVLALSIDLTFFLTKILTTISQWSKFWPAYLAWFIGLRATDFLAELLPLISFGGVLWTEFAHTTSRERLVVWLSGRTLLQCLVPALVFGAAIGIVELALNLYLRPMSVMTMAANHLGIYGERFDSSPRPDPQWLAAGHDLVQAIVEPGQPPSLHAVRVYRMDGAFELRSVFRAKTAKPADDHAWMLTDGTRWRVGGEADGSPAQSGSFSEESFAQQKLDLELAPVWVDNFRIPPRYLLNDVFLAIIKIGSPPNSEFRTWQQARYSIALFCAAMPLLAAVLWMLLMASDFNLVMMGLITLAGYLANTVMKVFILLGEHGYVTPIAAGWSLPAFVLLFCAAIAALKGGWQIPLAADSRALRSAQRRVASPAIRNDGSDTDPAGRQCQVTPG